MFRHMPTRVVPKRVRWRRARWRCRRDSWSMGSMWLEARVLLTLTASVMSEAALLAIGSPVSGKLAAGGADFYEIQPSEGGRLIAEIQAGSSSLELRLSFFDAQGNLLVQSDGQSLGQPDPRIDEHLDAGTDFLEIQSLSGSGTYSISTSLTPSSGLYQTLPPLAGFAADPFSPLAVGDFNNDGVPDLVTPSGLYLPTRDGTFQPPAPGGALVDPSQNPSAIAVGDFNGDHNLDVAITLAGTDSVSISLGNGNGTFQAATIVGLPAGSEPEAIMAGDFTGSGYTDLAVADAGTNSVTILQNDGQGNFQVLETIPVGSGPVALTAGDFENDGRIDLAVAGSGEVTVLSNQGGGNFQALPPIELHLEPGSTQASIVAGDFGTGHLDLAVTDFFDFHYKVDFLQGNGDGTFQTPVTYTVGPDPSSIVAGEFTGDGRTDLAVANYGDNTVSVLVGNGNGTFQAQVTYAAGSSPSSIVAGDFTGDGRTDLAVANNGDNTVSVLEGNGNGTFQEPAGDYIGASAYQVATGDFNGDGNLDLAVINNDSNNLSILLGNGDGTFQTATTIALPAGIISPEAIVTADFNGDGRTDLAVAEGYGVSVFLGNGDGTFQSLPPIPVAGGAFGIAAGDFAGNGRVDLAVSSLLYNTVTILLNNGDGTFQTGQTILLGDPNDPPSLGPIVAGDFNGDGRLDLAVASVPYVLGSGSGTDDITVLLGNGNGTFQPQQPTSLGELGFSNLFMVAGDFRNDGRTDLAVAVDAPPNSGVYDSLDVLLGNGNGTLQSPDVTYLDNDNSVGPVGIVAGDFTGSGRLDLATADSNGNFNGDDYSVYLGNADGTFQAPIKYSLGGSGYSTALVAGDFAGNGRTDLAITQSAPNQVFVLLNNGNGTFSDPAATNLARHETPLVADINGDGTPDVIEIDSSGDILYRQGIPGQPGSFLPPVTVNLPLPDGSNLYASRGIAWLPSTDQGPVLASVDATNDEISYYAYRKGGFVRLSGSTTGKLPAQIIAADLNQDGLTDWVVRNAGDGTLTVFFGTQPRKSEPFGPPGQPDDPAFQAPVILSVGPGISDVQAVDTTGTGLLDLVVTNQLSGQVSILDNEGDGTFAPPVSYRAGAEISQIDTSSVPEVSSPEGTAGVVAGPPTPGAPTDLVTINPGSNTLDVLAGLGQGRFANPVQIDTPSPARVVRVADLTGNGVLDLAVLTAQGVSIYLGDGHGGFAPPVTYGAGTDPTGLTVADLLGNGRLDLLVGNAEGDVLILDGNGDGTFRPFEPVNNAIALAVADLTGNGIPDFVFADQSLNQVSVVYGTTGEKPNRPTVIGNQATGVLAPGAVLLKDMNGDGIPDLIVANSGGNNVLVYPGLGDGQFGPPIDGTQGFAVGTDPTGLTVANLNGQPDLLVADKGSNDVSVLLGQGSGKSWTMTPGPRIKTEAGPAAVVVGNMLPNNQMGLAVANSGADTVQVFPSVGQGFFNDQPTATKNFVVGQDPSGLFLGDFNGALGLATLNAGSDNGTLITGVGSRSPQLQTFATGGDRPTTGFAGDFDGNGFTDLVVGNNGDGHLALLLGGSGGLSLFQTTTSALAPSPTGLSFGGFSDGSLNFYVSTAGREAAFNLAFDLGGGPEPELDFTVTEASAAAVLSQATTGSVQQVSELLSLSGSMLDLAATLLTVSVVDIESTSGAPATGASAGQGPGPAIGSSNQTGYQPGDEAGRDVLESQAAIETAPPWERLAIGLEQSWERARAAILQLDGRLPAAEDRIAPVRPADGRQPTPPVPLPSRPPTKDRTGAQARPAPPSRAATAAPAVPVEASSMRIEKAVDGALTELEADRAAHGPRSGWQFESADDPARAEYRNQTRALAAAVQAAALAGAGWALGENGGRRKHSISIRLQTGSLR